MPRRPCCKSISGLPGVRYFKPQGIPQSELLEVTLEVHELEALRLVHAEGFYQQGGAERMGISRASFGRILESAHQKVTEALVDGCALRIEGGDFHIGGSARCPRCRRPPRAKKSGTTA
jgi:predicted DNA-binding protein (UPF0251 family)